MIAEQELLKKISGENQGFKKLLDNHHELKEKIQEFERRRFLTPAEELESKRLKKLKLKEKDLMMQMVNEYRSKNALAAE